VRAIADRAIFMLDRLADGHMSRNVSRAALPALLPARLAAAQIERLRRGGYDPMRAESIAPSAFDIWRLLATRIRGRV
jgi:hypothetical protein